MSTTWKRVLTILTLLVIGLIALGNFAMYQAIKVKHHLWFDHCVWKEMDDAVTEKRSVDDRNRRIIEECQKYAPSKKIKIIVSSSDTIVIRDSRGGSFVHWLEDDGYETADSAHVDWKY